MKKFAFYLPQFHETEENNEWWGKGFTEWTNVKKAAPLFKGHNQPVKPLNNNYYNLLDKETVEWQTDLMKKYNIDGLIYYHYYFCGKLLLEKPAENLLKWKDINQPFFFCWGNHTWNRAWKGSREVLIEQRYGDEKEWEKHFNYLLPFFKDERYEKRNNKPLFMIYNAIFPEKKQLFDYFDKKCRENGFDGLCLIETYQYNVNKKRMEEFSRDMCKETEFMFFREASVAKEIYLNKFSYLPLRIIRKVLRTLNKYKLCSYVQTYSGNALYKHMIYSEPTAENIIRGLFFEWDNTPRHGSRGYIITPPRKKLFFQFMDMLKEEEYVFINAWNEWAEGMMLEPTEHNKYKYLEWVKEWTDMH